MAIVEAGSTNIREFYAYVWRHRRQIILIILAAIAALLAMAPLELQRHCKYPRRPGES